MSTKLSKKLERINASMARIREKTNLPNAVIEDVATAVEKLSDSGGTGENINVPNGKIDSGYYASTGSIEPFTFVNTSVITSATPLTVDGTIQQAARLDNDHIVVVSHTSGSDCAVQVYKGTELQAKLILDAYVVATYSVCTAEDGENIFVLLGSVGYSGKYFHLSYKNGALTQKTMKESTSVSTMNYMGQLGIHYFKKVGDTHYCLGATHYSNTPYIMIFTSDGISAAVGPNCNLHSSNSYAAQFGGFAVIDDAHALVSTRKVSSSGTESCGTYLLTINGTTITKTLLEGSTTRYPDVLKVSDKLILVATIDATTYNLLLDQYVINSDGTVTYNGVYNLLSLGSSNYNKIKMASLNNDNFIISYYKDNLCYVPCTINGTDITYGTPITTSQNGSDLIETMKKGTNSIQSLIGSNLLVGTLNGLDYSVGVKYVTPSISTINGITNTACTEDSPGEIWIL